MSGPSTWDAPFDGAPIGVVDSASEEVIERRARRRARRGEKSKRRDIQGLRMVAVVAVVINHLTGHPQGGFVGVDVFFVISGFLITGHLLREEGKSGHISLVDFYRRRIRRLFPSALAVTVATVIAGYFIFDGVRFHQTWVDAIWATLFSANWRFIDTGTDYFQAAGPVPPLQHYWSLSVEEQFYVVWPLVLLLVLLAARKAFGGRRNALALAGLFAGLMLFVPSLLVAARQSTTSPVEAYFSTFTRGWELGLGALCAVLAPYVRGNKAVMTLVSWTGLAVVVASLFLVNESNFPYPGAVVPCVGSALVIMAKSNRASADNIVLTNRLSNYLGDISYSIYVVHFPVIIFAQALLNKESGGTDLALTAAILGLSMLLFHLLENPVRQSQWLKPRRERGVNVTAGWNRTRATIVAVTFTVVGFAALSLVVPSGASKLSEVLNAEAQAPDPVETSAFGPAQIALQKQLQTALSATSWPKLDPSFTEVATHSEPYLLHCGDTTLGSDASCSWGAAPPKHTIYLVGDSTSMAYTPAFRAIINSLPGWRVRALGGFGCAFANVVLADDNNHTTGCLGRNDDVIAAIKAAKPDLLVVTNVIANNNYTAGVRAQLAKVQGDYGKLVMLPAPPKVIDPSQCYTNISSPQDCVAQVPSGYSKYLTNDALIAADFKGTLIDPTPWYCRNSYCPAFLGTIPTRRDAEHTSSQYAALIGPVVRETFERNELFSAVK